MLVALTVLLVAFGALVFATANHHKDRRHCYHLPYIKPPFTQRYKESETARLKGICVAADAATLCLYVVAPGWRHWIASGFHAVQRPIFRAAMWAAPPLWAFFRYRNGESHLAWWRHGLKPAWEEAELAGKYMKIMRRPSTEFKREFVRRPIHRDRFEREYTTEIDGPGLFDAVAESIRVEWGVRRA